jgi:PhnB protein
MKAVNPYLNFNGNTEEAFAFYRSVFGGDFFGLIRYRDFGDNAMGAPDSDLDKIAHVALPLGKDNLLMGTDVLESQGQGFSVGNNVYIHLEADSAEDADRLFSGLAAGGQTQMPLQQTEWAEQYGVCADRFGVQWMVSYTGSVEFPGSQQG